MMILYTKKIYRDMQAEGGSVEKIDEILEIWYAFT